MHQQPILQTRKYLPLIISIALSACSSSPGASAIPSPAAIAAGNATEPPAQSAAPVQPDSTAPDLVISETDPCKVVSEEQVKSAFSRDVAKVEPGSGPFAGYCYYTLKDQGGQITVIINDGEGASKKELAHLEDLQLECEQDVENCRGYQNFPSQYHPDIAGNVLTYEWINAKSNLWGAALAVLTNNKTIQITYLWSIESPDVQNALLTAPDKESYYKIATPYRDQILIAYTENLLRLIKEAYGQ